LGQVTSDFGFFDKACEIAEIVQDDFADNESPFFFYTGRQQEDILLRKKEVYDGATPSGNAVMAQNLYKLSIIYDRQVWRSSSEAMINVIGEAIFKYPTSFGVWLSLLFEIIKGTNEIAVLGKQQENYLEKLLSIYIPHKIVLASEKPIKKYPLLADKAETSEILIYLCKNYACRYPVNTIQDLLDLL